MGGWLRQVLRLIADRYFPKYNWIGIHRSFSDIGDRGAGFDGLQWAKDTAALTRMTKSACTSRVIPKAVQGDDALLGMLVSTIKAGNRPVSIVDFGGGAGISYIHARSSISGDVSLRYRVIESAPVVDEGKRLFVENDEISFSTTFPEPGEPVDVVFVSTALQYVEDTNQILKKMAMLGPTYFLFVKLSAGEIPDFVTTQVNVHGSRIPYRFLNVAMFIDQMNILGYELRYRTQALGILNMENFPASHRLQACCNLMFEKKAAT